MALTLAEIRAKLQQQEATKTGGSGSGDSAVYAHWNIAEGSTSRIRFLPDGNPQNSYFWVERAMIKLPFAGIKGEPTSKPVQVQVPCIEMFAGYEGKCPILAEVRPWFKDKSLEEMGRKYWKKKSYLFQGFVREDGLKEDKHPENPIRRFVISPQIFNVVKTALMDPEMEEIPTDYLRGLDFQIIKTSKGGYADYSTSKWSRKESGLTPDEMAAIEKFGLYDLSSFLPKMPTAEELDIMKEMFEASVDGQPYDPARWSKYFKPFGLKDDAAAEAAAVAQGTTVSVSAPKPAPVAVSTPVASDVDDDDTPAATTPVTTPAAGGAKRAEDIIAMIRNRKA